MKRSAALAPLSRDHHVALVVARELARATAATAEPAATRFVRFLAEHEVAHFALEEQVLLPALPRQGPGPDLARRVLEDHEYLRAALRRVQGSPGEASADLLHEVGARLRAHVRLEEQELFPYLEETLDPEALDEIGARLSERPGSGDGR